MAHLPLHCCAEPSHRAATGVPPAALQVYSRALAGAQAGWGKELSSMQGWGYVLLWAASSASLMHQVSARRPPVGYRRYPGVVNSSLVQLLYSMCTAATAFGLAKPR